MILCRAVQNEAADTGSWVGTPDGPGRAFTHLRVIRTVQGAKAGLYQWRENGVRTVDVIADEDLCIPGYEYHFLDDGEDPPVMFSQIPEGYAGETSEVDRYRADASPWLDRLPVIRAFRRQLRRPAATRRRKP